MLDDELERLRAILAHAHEPPRPGKLKISLRKIKGKLTKKIVVAMEKNRSTLKHEDVA